MIDQKGVEWKAIKFLPMNNMSQKLSRDISSENHQDHVITAESLILGVIPESTAKQIQWTWHKHTRRTQQPRSGKPCRAKPELSVRETGCSCSRFLGLDAKTGIWCFQTETFSFLGATHKAKLKNGANKLQICEIWTVGSQQHGVFYQKISTKRSRLHS